MRTPSRLTLPLLALFSLVLMLSCKDETPSNGDRESGPPAGDAIVTGDSTTGLDSKPATDADPNDSALLDSAPPAKDTGAPKCTLSAKGPQSSTKAGQVITRLKISSTSGAALTIKHDNVIVREVEILHSGGPGIHISSANNVLIEDVVIRHTGAPASGKNSSDDRNNIDCYGAQSPTIKRARLTRGSSGIYLVNCPGSKLSFIEGHDFRGPFPRGQLVQWDKSSGGLLEDFSVINPVGSWPEDNVNVYKCINVTIRRGHIDGNNSPSGVGVIFDGDTATGLVEDVDAIRMGNGCFSNYAGASGSTFRRVRCRENICGDQGRGKPLSNALMFAGNPGGATCKLENASYWASCNNNLTWPNASFSVLQLKKVDFKMRAPIVNTFCWE
jgi:hypothetical protein